MIIDHNLDYLLTRPGALKLTTVVLGVVSCILCSHSYDESPYTDFYEDQVENGNKNASSVMPGTELELGNVTITVVILGISLVYLAIHSFFDLSESRANKFMDTAFHMCAGFFLFTGGCVLIYSAVHIEKNGCPMLQFGYIPSDSESRSINAPFGGVLSFLDKAPWNYLPKSDTDGEERCHYLGEKIVGACFNMVNAVIYAVNGYVIFTAKVEDM